MQGLVEWGRDAARLGGGHFLTGGHAHFDGGIVDHAAHALENFGVRLVRQAADVELRLGGVRDHVDFISGAQHGG